MVNKHVIVKSITDAKGIVRVVFATVALGMGVNLAALNRIVHYGAPRSLDDYFQECGPAGRSGEQAFSTVFWCPKTNSPCSKTRHYYSVISKSLYYNICTHFSNGNQVQNCIALAFTPRALLASYNTIGDKQCTHTLSISYILGQ